MVGNYFSQDRIFIFVIVRSLSGDSNLYPFGSSQGDIQMRRVDDGVSSVISIPTCFYVGRTRHRDAYVLPAYYSGPCILLIRFSVCIDFQQWACSVRR